MSYVVSPRYITIEQVQSDLKSGKITCQELAKYYLKRIEHTRDLNIYLEVYEDEVLFSAARQDELLQEGNHDQLGKLFGVFINHKDVICVKDHEVSAGSKILSGFKSLYTATVVQRLLDQGALLIGRVNCDEFAMGSSNQNSFFGPTRNPHHTEYIPGGSSGASAVSVAVDTCLCALGTDTGGSVRQPASFCGVFGMKPSYGALSRHGVIAYGSSFDQIGFLSQSTEVIQKVFLEAKGIDPKDSTSMELDFTISNKSTLRFGYFETLDSTGFLDPAIHKAFDQFKAAITRQGHELVPVKFPLLDYLVPSYYILTTAEASSNLSRYDGVRYGHRTDSSEDIQALYKNTRTEGFGHEVKRRLMMGTFVLSAGYYDAYYGKAQKVRRLLIESLSGIFSQIDFLINPLSPNRPWKIGENLDDPVKVYMSDVLTVYANLAGLPAIALPWTTDHEKLPIGMQVTGSRKSDFDLLNIKVSDLKS